METNINFFANLYPLSLIAVILLFFIWQALKVKKKRNGLLNLIIAVAIITYFVSFFANYKLGLFLIVWFIRDILIFVIIMNIYEVALKNKKLLLLFMTVVFIVVAVVVNNSLKAPGAKVGSSDF